MTKLNLFSFIAVIFFLFLAGCDGNTYTPEITGREVVIVKPEPIPDVPEITMPVKINGVPSSWYPPRGREKGWKAIMIHHSATKNGNAAIFDDQHKKINRWKGIGYDFVICNGNGKSDGTVEVTFRWKEQIPGAHVGGTRDNWANVDGIGICLVGDFSKKAPSRNQMASLTKLVRFLQGRYHIGNSKVYGHNETPGASSTKCPGRYFPMARFKRSL